MDIQSFILGVGVMLVIALVIGSVFSVVKVIKLGKEFRDVQVWINQEFENQKKVGEQQIMIVNNQINEVYRTIDSRCDKLYEKILKEQNPKNRILQLIKNESKNEDFSNNE
jgi:hypothetical protein